MRLLVGPGAVPHSARDDVELARAELDVPVLELDRQLAVEDEEVVVGSGCECQTNSP